MYDMLLVTWSVFSTALGWFWSALQVVFAIPVIGLIAQIAFYGTIGWALYKTYRMLPNHVRRVAQEKVFPYASTAAIPLRWYLARLIAPGPIIRPGEAGTKVIEKEVIVEVPVPMRRSFRQWIMSGVRWGLFYALTYATYANWTSIWPYVSQHLR